MGPVSEQRVHTNLLHLRETVLCSRSFMHFKGVVGHIAVLEGQQSWRHCCCICGALRQASAFCKKSWLTYDSWVARWNDDTCRAAAVTCTRLIRRCTSPRPFETLLKLQLRLGRDAATQVPL